MNNSYLNLLSKFKKRLNLEDDLNPDYYFLHGCCVDFFNGVENLSKNKIINFIKKFDFNSLYKINSNGDIYLAEKNYFILSELLALTVDKYGIDIVVKSLLPENIERHKSNLFYNLLNIFLSIFRKTKINIKQGYASSSVLAKAVDDLRKLKNRKGLPALDRGENFIQALSTLCILTFNKYVTPIKKCTSFEENLKKVVKNKLAVEINLNAGRNWWNDIKSNSTSSSNAEWSDSEWDDYDESHYDRPNSVSEVTYEILPWEGASQTSPSSFIDKCANESQNNELHFAVEPIYENFPLHAGVSGADSGCHSDSEESAKQSSDSSKAGKLKNSLLVQGGGFFSNVQQPSMIQKISVPLITAGS